MERDPMETALSTDVIMDIILSHLRVRDLLSCRLASKFWNNAASSALRRRSTMMKEISEENRLTELEECMKESSDFPFAGLQLDKPWTLNSVCAVEFFQHYGDRFTRLRLNAPWVIRLHAMAPFINHISRLFILEVGGCSSSSPPSELLDSDVGQEDGKILKLQSVQTIRIPYTYPEVNEDVIREVFTAASPSLRVECEDVTPAILRALKGAGKLGAMSFIKFDYACLNTKVQLEMDQLLSTGSPSLTKLHFAACACISRRGLQALLLSSQNTLKELSLDGMCLFEKSWDEFPVLAKLTKLGLCIDDGVVCERLGRGAHGHKFPALNTLKFDIPYARYETLRASLPDGLFVVPSVTMIYLQCYINEIGMKMLAQWFPNVVEMRLDYEFYSGEYYPPGTNPFQMWNVREFKSLEKLIIWGYKVDECLETGEFISMDRFLTGMPSEICENLRKQQRLDLGDSPFNEVLRYYPNILQLQSLKELTICVQRGWGIVESAQETPFISMVSVWYALEMMPSLRVKFVYEEYPEDEPGRIEERDKAILKAAFKHAQPSIKLEPFFY